MATRMLIIIVAFGLAACGQKSVTKGIPEAAGDAAPQAILANAKDAGPPAVTVAAAPGPGHVAAIAYSYHLGFELPDDQLDLVQRQHRAACAALGPTHCQLLGSSRSRDAADGNLAGLDLRVDPAAIKVFAAKLAATAAAAGGSVLFDNVDGEDVTRQLIDADAALKAKRTLRDRLQTLLESHPGRLADLLAVEKALSDAQQALDTAAAELAELRQRVDFSQMSIVYRSTKPAGSTARPLAEAMANAGATISASLALLLTATLALLPWLLPIGLVVWLIVRARRAARRGGPA